MDPIKHKVLVVDDDVKNLHAYSRLLSSPEIEVVQAGSGEKALALVFSHDFFLILMDVNMPVMDGFETATMILEHPKTAHLPIIFVTAIGTSDEFVFKGYKTGAIDYLLKPINKVTLKSKVGVFLKLYKQKILLAQEIEKRKETEIQLNRAKKAAEKAQRSAEETSAFKSGFLASMSHEIRTPMNGVLGMLRLLQDTELTEDQRRKTEIAQSSARTLLSLINDILDFSKVESGKLKLEVIDFDIRQLFGEFAQSMALRVEEKDIEFILDTINVSTSRVKGDPGRIRQILVNLVGNSIKFTHHGEIVVRAGLKQMGPDESQLSCTVCDTGIGIPAGKKHSLFEPFTQLDASTTREYGGTGLGLSIVKQLCELMGGSISVVSEEGKGSCFEFSVLLKSSAKPQVTVPTIKINELSLLIVDDNATNRIVLQEQLENWGAHVEVAVDGPEALKILKQKSKTSMADDRPAFDAVFLDMQMPDMDGAELGRQIKASVDFAATKMVMMTSMGHRGDAQYFANLGFSAYFSKPATTADLYTVLSVIAEGGEALQQAEPLVTHHYLQTLAKPQAQKICWPEKARLLLVEDNSINQEVAEGILNSIGLQTDIAHNGVEALQILAGESELDPFSLVLMDCQMPEMDGYEATRNIRAGKGGESNKNIPIIAMTASAMLGDKEKCLAAGMNDYLSKPLETDELEKMLSIWLQAAVASKTLPAKEKAAIKNKDVASKRLVWDKAAALKRLDGDEKILKNVIRLFYRDIPLEIRAIEEAFKVKDLDQVRITSHIINGVAANLSGLAFQQQASELEGAARSNDIKKVNESIPKLKWAYEKLVKEFSRYVKPDSADD